MKASFNPSKRVATHRLRTTGMEVCEKHLPEDTVQSSKLMLFFPVTVSHAGGMSCHKCHDRWHWSFRGVSPLCRVCLFPSQRSPAWQCCWCSPRLWPKPTFSSCTASKPGFHQGPNCTSNLLLVMTFLCHMLPSQSSCVLQSCTFISCAYRNFQNGLPKDAAASKKL